MSNWAKFRALPVAHRRLFVEAAILLGLVGAALKVMPYRICRSGLSLLAGEPTADTGREGLRRARNIAEVVRAAGRHGPTGYSCLRESLVLWHLLRRSGIRSQLRIGVRKDGGNLDAHAWVECQGLVLNDNDDVHVRYAAFENAVKDI